MNLDISSANWLPFCPGGRWVSIKGTTFTVAVHKNIQWKKSEGLLVQSDGLWTPGDSKHFFDGILHPKAVIYYIT